MYASRVAQYTVAGLKGGTRDARPSPWGSKFFQFHAVFGEIWQNHMLAPPSRVGAPDLGEILDPPLVHDLACTVQGRGVQELGTHTHTHTHTLSLSLLKI